MWSSSKVKRWIYSSSLYLSHHLFFQKLLIIVQSYLRPTLLSFTESWKSLMLIIVTLISCWHMQYNPFDYFILSIAAISALLLILFPIKPRHGELKKLAVRSQVHYDIMVKLRIQIIKLLLECHLSIEYFYPVLNCLSLNYQCLCCWGSYLYLCQVRFWCRYIFICLKTIIVRVLYIWYKHDLQLWNDKFLWIYATCEPMGYKLKQLHELNRLLKWVG